MVRINLLPGMVYKTCVVMCGLYGQVGVVRMMECCCYLWDEEGGDEIVDFSFCLFVLGRGMGGGSFQ